MSIMLRTQIHSWSDKTCGQSIIADYVGTCWCPAFDRTANLLYVSFRSVLCYTQIKKREIPFFFLLFRTFSWMIFGFSFFCCLFVVYIHSKIVPWHLIAILYVCCIIIVCGLICIQLQHQLFWVWIINFFIRRVSSPRRYDSQTCQACIVLLLVNKYTHSRYHL